MHEMLHKRADQMRARRREVVGECVWDRESGIDSYWEDFQQGSSWEYCGAAAEMLGMLMLLLIMQLWNPATHKHTQRHLRDNRLAKANTTDHFCIITISNSCWYIFSHFLIQHHKRYSGDTIFCCMVNSGLQCFKLFSLSFLLLVF